MADRSRDAQAQRLPHRLVLDERRKLTVTGVSEVLRVDDRSVALKTVQGLLVLRGEQLQLKQLAPEGGQVTVTGEVAALSYESVQSGGLLRRLFG